MKRKTNLFYATGNDSKFITFSNYTETLTGNFLSTDTKLYPTKFLCINIPSLTSYASGVEESEKMNAYASRKENLIKFLVAYYENKLATLRDHLIENDVLPENKMLPLNYLLEALYKIQGFDDNNEVIFENSKISENPNAFTIPYIGEITEQDYNGTYTDTICIIDISKYKAGEIDIDLDVYQQVGQSCGVFTSNQEDHDQLHGWTYETVPSTYRGLSPIYDLMINDANSTKSSETYRIDSGIKGITLKQGVSESVTFNLMIPLFDLTNINYKTNNTSIVEEDTEISLKFDALNNVLYNKNVPLGMWFSGYEPVKLAKDSTTGYAPSWSLLIGSQFKPFPYSSSIPSEISNDSKANAYPTFAMVMSRQNEMIDKMESLMVQFAEVRNRLDQVESQLNMIGTIHNIDSIHKEFIAFEKSSNEQMEDFKTEVKSYLSNLKWKTTI